MAQTVRSTSSAPAEPQGSVTPRLWTPPLRDLTAETSYGYEVVDFADQVLGLPLDPWEQWAVIHAGELLEDGQPRFRVVLVLVARQNGKTLLAKVLTLFWMFVEAVPLTLGLSTTLGYAKVAWSDCIAIARANEHLRDEIGAIRYTIGEEAFPTIDGAAYRIAAANRRAGRSLTVHRLIVDEIREHATFDAWNAATYAMNAVPDGQVVAIKRVQVRDVGALRRGPLEQAQPRVSLPGFDVGDGGLPQAVQHHGLGVTLIARDLVYVPDTVIVEATANGHSADTGAILERDDGRCVYVWQGRMMA